MYRDMLRRLYADACLAVANGTDGYGDIVPDYQGFADSPSQYQHDASPRIVLMLSNPATAPSPFARDAPVFWSLLIIRIHRAKDCLHEMDNKTVHIPLYIPQLGYFPRWKQPRIFKMRVAGGAWMMPGGWLNANRVV